MSGGGGDQCNTWESWSSVKGFFFPALLDAFLHTAAILRLVVMVVMIMTWNRTRIMMIMTWRIMSVMIMLLMVILDAFFHTAAIWGLKTKAM